MPSVTMIGEKRRGHKVPTALPAEARSLSRLLNLLQSSEVASAALMGALSQVPPSPQRQEIHRSLQETAKSLQALDLPVKEISDRMSIATELAIRLTFQNPELAQKDATKKQSHRRDTQEDGSDFDSITPPMTTRGMKMSAAAMVSDCSTTGSESESEVMDDLDVSFRIKQFWGSLLEALHLQVASRTTRVWGKKKIYEVYELTANSTVEGSLDDIRKSVEREFRTVFHGGGEDQSGCRTYAVMSENGSLYVQLNIGKQYDFNDESNRSICGEKKKKADFEFTAIINEGSPLVALSASRAPSRSRFTKFVLSSLDAALTKSGIATSKDIIPTRVGDWSGTEPDELLASAHAAREGQAVGRFAHYASEEVADPLTELHMASTSSLLDRTSEQKRLMIGAQHDRSIAHVAKSVQAPAELIAVNKRGMLVDHSALAKLGRKRARNDQIGQEGDYTRLERLCWKWTGETTAASACWLQDDEPTEDLPKTKFKCGVVMQGTNIVEGLRAMMDSGLAEAPLPDFVRDAPSLGRGTIVVDNGSFAGSDTFAAV